MKQQFLFKFKHVRYIIFILFFSQTSFAAVSGYKLASAGKFVNCQHTVIGTSLAAGHDRIVFQGIDPLKRQHGSFAAVIMFPGDQCSTERSHDSRYVRSYRFAARDFLKTTQYRIIIKCSSLNHDPSSEIRRIRYLDDFQQCIFYNGISQTCRNIFHGGPFLLCLLYL